MTLSDVLCRYVVILGSLWLSIETSGIVGVPIELLLTVQKRVECDQRLDLLLPRGLGTMYSLLGSHSSGWKSGFKKWVRLKWEL